MAKTLTYRSIASLEQTTGDVALDTRGGEDYQRVNLGGGCDAASNQGSQVSVVPTAGGSTVLAANATRRGFTFYIEGDSYLSFGGTPSSSTYKLFAYQPFNMLDGLIYLGEIKAISASGTVVAHVLEF